MPTPRPIREIRHHWQMYLLILPAVVLVGLFQYYPTASGVYHSFFRWNGADISEFVGLENYTDLLTRSEFWNSFRVALIIGGWNILKMIPAVAVAICIHRCRSEKMQFAYRALFVVPAVIPGLVIVLIWRSFFFEAGNGYLNLALHNTGLMSVLGRLDQWLGWGGVFVEGRNPAWLGDPRLILVAAIVWGFPWVGSFAVLTHLAKLQSISKDVYEAGEIDGVNWWSKFTRIELPLMMGSIYLLLVFVIIETIKDAGMIIALAGMEGGPGGVATVPALFMIRKAFIDQQMGYACAVGIVLTVIVLAAQKLSAAVGDWGALPSWQRHGWRTVTLILALVMMWTGTMPLLAAVLLLASLPYRGLMRRFRRVPGDVEPIPRHPPALPPASVARPVSRFRRTAKDLALRAAKHGFIWLVLAFAFLPVYLMIVVSVKTNQQFYREPASPTAPAHWENWSTAWESVRPALANSLFIAISSTALTLAVGIGAAYFFARRRMPMSGLLWNAILILMMMPTIANLVPLFRLLRDLDLVNTLTALILVGAAGGQAFAIFVLRSFVADIPRDLFEAAEIDGAGHLRQLRTVVIPLAAPILGTVGVMHFIGQWNDFVLPLIIIRDQDRLPVMVQLLRLAGEYIKHWGPLMAGYTLASLPVVILFVLSMRLFTRGLTEGAVKG